MARTRMFEKNQRGIIWKLGTGEQSFLLFGAIPKATIQCSYIHSVVFFLSFLFSFVHVTNIMCENAQSNFYNSVNVCGCTSCIFSFLQGSALSRFPILFHGLCDSNMRSRREGSAPERERANLEEPAPKGEGPLCRDLIRIPMVDKFENKSAFSEGVPTSLKVSV